jgi:pyrroloquinoline quinone biosynthesis protein B
MRLADSGLLWAVLASALAPATPARCESPAPEPAPIRAAAPQAAIDPPKLHVLGIAQDAGVPQAACDSPNCEAARRDPSRRHLAASVAIALPGGAVWLVDATPDLREQLDIAIALGTASGASPPRRRPVAGVLLTHGHMGHYLGLAHFGFEAAHTDQIPVRATARMAALLRDNAPWGQLVRLRNIVLEEITPGVAFDLGPVRVVPIAVPHRAEYTDTLAYRFEGPRTTVLYIPDTDHWAKHDDPASLFDGVDIALVDATFASMDELPGRDLEEIAHPTVASTIALLEDRVARGELQVVLIHLNHSNPLLDPQRRGALPTGFGVAEAGLEIAL